ncbi:TauD/TfdA family dioxygenase [Roseiarcaceae bacterium H3SJ34-1]|uniref:TauD/TfdA dioxygenase family protein n=1 Tax=Terripilifer ovatus TaxID=3032367 RepID=UPI003AB9BBCD|nr:TauD/TfdA family dioxygenase [Roseiarcaceae bacterium H3SJ34-1]
MMSSNQFNLQPMSEVLGARVLGLDLRRSHDADLAAAMRAALAEHHVLCVPAQEIEADDQIRFAQMFGKANAEFLGKPEKAEYASEDGPDKRGILYISNLREDGKAIGALPDGELHFHSDGAHRAKPYRATTLFAIKVPSRGGETKFANLTTAWETLSHDLKEQIDGLKVRNVYDTRATLREQTDASDDKLSNAVHPLVRIHPDTGRKSLYLSRLMTRSIVGLTPEDSDALLNELFEHIEKTKFIHAHKWTPGDLLIWDNRSVNHARSDFPSHEPRHLRRVAVSEPE